MDIKVVSSQIKQLIEHKVITKQELIDNDIGYYTIDKVMNNINSLKLSTIDRFIGIVDNIILKKIELIDIYFQNVYHIRLKEMENIADDLYKNSRKV